MNELHYKGYKTTVTQCSCCNRCITEDVFERIPNSNNWKRVFITARADSLEQLVKEFETSVDKYLEAKEEIHKKAMSAFEEVKEDYADVFKKLAEY